MTIDKLEAEIVQLRRRLSDAEAASRALEQAAAADQKTLRRLEELSRYCADHSHELADCLQRILEAAVATTGADKGNIQLLDAQSGALTIAVQRGFEAPFLQFFATVGRDDVAACGAAMAASQRIVVEDVTKSELFAGQPSLQVLLDAGVRAVQATPLTSSGGAVVGMISTHFGAPRRMGEAELRWMDLLARQAADYLVRVQAEQAERESRQQLAAEEARARLAAIVDSADDAIVSKDLNGVIRSWNRGAERIFGWTAAEAVGRHITLIIPEERHAEEDAILARIRRGLSVDHFETVRVTKNGERRDISLTVSPVRDRADRIIGASKIARDVTDRRRLEAERDRLLVEAQASNRELQDREARIRRLVDANIIGVVIADFEGPILEANDAFLQMLGYTRDDLAAGRMHWTALTPPEWHAVTVRALEQIRRTGRSTTYETEFIRNDRTRVPALVGGAAFEGTRTRAVFFVLDLSERKRGEDALQRAHAELAHVTRMTTLGELAASIAHEINQPLAAIVADADAALNWLIGARPDRERVRETLESIVADAHRAADVIQQLRQLTTKRAPHRAPLDVNAVIRDVAPLVRAELLRHQVVLELDLAPDLHPVTSDRAQLQQVVINLVVNAIEAMASVTGRAREVVIRSAPSEPGYVTVGVQDTGPGIDPATADKIFSAFYTTKTGGMGMGLSISRSIIEAHGGRLWVSPGDPDGAVFQFSLPVDRPASEGEDAKEH